MKEEFTAQGILGFSHACDTIYVMTPNQWSKIIRAGLRDYNGTHIADHDLGGPCLAGERVQLDSGHNGGPVMRYVMPDGQRVDVRLKNIEAKTNNDSKILFYKLDK